VGNSVKISLTILFVFSLFSCDSNKVYEEYIEVENGVWKRENTISAHNIYINIRNRGDYANSNLYLFLTLQGPDGSLLKDTVNCILADNRGKWLGTGIGDLWDLRIPYIGGFKFAQSGNYIISYEQAMRVENGLDGITDVGVRVEKAD
jgi:gliding motility-associated lipoprotein GldH